MKELDGKVKLGCFDVKLSKDLAGEFGVRKFNLPQVRRVARLSFALGAISAHASAFRCTGI